MVVITSKYIKPSEVIDTLAVEHRKFLDDCYKKAQFICSGPQIPRVGGVLIANVATIDEAKEIMKNDPSMELLNINLLNFHPLNMMNGFHVLSNRIQQKSKSQL